MVKLVVCATLIVVRTKNSFMKNTPIHLPTITSGKAASRLVIAEAGVAKFSWSIFAARKICEVTQATNQPA